MVRESCPDPAGFGKSSHGSRSLVIRRVGADGKILRARCDARSWSRTGPDPASGCQHADAVRALRAEWGSVEAWTSQALPSTRAIGLDRWQSMTSTSLPWAAGEPSWRNLLVRSAAQRTNEVSPQASSPGIPASERRLRCMATCGLDSGTRDINRCGMEEPSPPRPDQASDDLDQLTGLLRRWSEGETACEAELLPLLYPHLRALAAKIGRASCRERV